MSASLLEQMFMVEKLAAAAGCHEASGWLRDHYFKPLADNVFAPVIDRAHAMQIEDVREERATPRGTMAGSGTVPPGKSVSGKPAVEVPPKDPRVDSSAVKEALARGRGEPGEATCQARKLERDGTRMQCKAAPHEGRHTWRPYRAGVEQDPPGRRVTGTAIALTGRASEPEVLLRPGDGVRPLGGRGLDWRVFRITEDADERATFEIERPGETNRLVPPEGLRPAS